MVCERITVEMRIAVIGAGIAGLGAAYGPSRPTTWRCSRRDARAGGHANTVALARCDLDTGFLVHNRRTTRA